MEFLTLLDKTQSIISGSTALAVCMQRTERASEWMDTRDLDIFTPVGMAESIVGYLVGKLDYTQTECLLASAAGGPGFPEEYDAMWTYHGSYTNNIPDGELRTVTRLVAVDGRRIDVMESATTCALLPLATFPLTHIMNYITGTTLVILGLMNANNCRDVIFSGAGQYVNSNTARIVSNL
ncbi:hypothetical protein PENSPDRAFT_690442 [Peniophora sp. CONT]|nr:hypothetical protein PENSPDRAFT_690442 [Peniophora sp. CONT]